MNAFCEPQLFSHSTLLGFVKPTHHQPTNTMAHNKQAVGAIFDLQKMHHARNQTMQAVHSIANQIVVDMSEVDARAMAMDVLQQMGMDRIWHPALVRFGANTLKKV